MGLLDFEDETDDGDIAGLLSANGVTPFNPNARQVKRQTGPNLALLAAADPVVAALGGGDAGSTRAWFAGQSESLNPEARTR